MSVIRGTVQWPQGAFFMFRDAAKTAGANTVAPARLRVGLPAVAACVSEELAGGMNPAPTIQFVFCRGGIYAALMFLVTTYCN